MGMFDKFKDAAEKAVDEHGDKIASGLDRAGDAIDDKTGGKHTEKIASGLDKAKDGLDGLDGRDDDIDRRQ